MRQLLGAEFWPGFFSGAGLHLLMLFTRVDLLKFECKLACDDIVYFDIPVSMFYFFATPGVVISSSFVFGTLVWGLYGFLALKALMYFLGETRR